MGVEIRGDRPGPISFDVTVRSDDTGWEGYADRWEVVTEDAVVAERVLLHPHVEEQPFTRSLGGVDLPDDVTIVTVRAHHSTGGFCGEPLEVDL